MSFAKMEGISGLNTLAIISGFCLCRFIFFKKNHLTDSYDFQMGEQERA